MKPAVLSINEDERVLEVVSLPSTGGKARGILMDWKQRVAIACLNEQIRDERLKRNKEKSVEFDECCR